jgi:hypothetical protein
MSSRLGAEIVKTSNNLNFLSYLQSVEANVEIVPEK